MDVDAYNRLKALIDGLADRMTDDEKRAMADAEWAADAALAAERKLREALECAVEEERGRWQEASGLERGGDPGGVTPEGLAKYIQSVEARAERAEADNAALLEQAQRMRIGGAHDPCVWCGAHVEHRPRCPVGLMLTADHPGAALLERLRALEKVADEARTLRSWRDNGLLTRPDVPALAECWRRIGDALDALEPKR